VHDPAFDPAVTAILTTEPGCALGPAPADSGTAEILGNDPGSWRIQTNSEAPALLILAETAYPGWQPFVDGRPASPLTAYTTLKAVCVPAGTHEVEWTYSPTVYMLGGLVSLLALLFVLLGWVLERRSKTAG
jgi:hypothetical protein